MSYRFHHVLAMSLAAVVACAALGEDIDIKKLRKEAAHRQRRMLFDNDGNEPVYYCDEATEKALLDKRTTPLLGSQVDTILYCTWSSGFSFFTHNTKVGEIFDSVAEEPGKGPGSGFSKNKTRAFIEQGTDPLAIMIKFCRANDIEIFWSMRMNDVHDAWGAWYSPHLFPTLKKEHPDWLMGTEEKRPVNGAWTAVDFAQPEIRDLAYRFFEEVCTNYDVDGVQLDFFRHLNYFRKSAGGGACGPEEHEMMTGLLRRIREMADRKGVERQHPILISVRVPDSVEFCKHVGLDIERWMAEDLIDILVVGGYFRLNPWETSVKLGHQYGVPVYPCLSETRIKDDEAKKLRASLQSYRARAMNVWHAGGDGVYMFNFFNPHSPLWHELGSPDTLKRLDKVYTTGARGYSSIGFWCEDGKRFMNCSFVCPDYPRKLEPGKTQTVLLPVGETFDAESSAHPTLRIRFADLASPQDVTMTWNDEPLPKAEQDGHWLEFVLEPAHIAPGDNQFTVTLSPDAAAGPVLEDLVLAVDYDETS